ncbi:MAG: N-acyl-D-amino-acid deacylase [Micromonosporaceae bacterium]|nr:N-acyl-D-amino-acid deacylase [Micromonosporaceae bacterium]
MVRGATVVDGGGGAGYRADITIDDARIAAITPARATTSGRRIDGDGLVLAPGFVDMHAHSELALLVDPAHLAKVSQGVTCEVLGQDGLSYAPVDDAVLTPIRQQLAGWHGDPPGLDWSWRSVAGYLDRLDAGIAVNACYLVPQGNVRAMVVGWDDRAPSGTEMDRMCALVATGLAEGAFGLSAGLTYPPGMYAGTAELVELCRVVAGFNGLFAVHHRSYGAGALAAYAEMVDLSRRSGCALHLAHATLNFPVNAGRGGELVALLDTAGEEGLDVTLDSYPYLVSSTTLASLLPSWAATGGPDATLARLADPTDRERIRVDVCERGSDGNHGVPVDWATITISGVRESALAGRVGRTMAALGGFDAFVDLLVADRLGTTIMVHAGHEENVRAVLRYGGHLVGSDGLLVGARPHPRAWGTFPRYLGHYVRDLGLLTVEECVARMTGRAARRLGLRGRGFIRVGYAADLVLFDPVTVADTATYESPRRQCTGIPYVFVNGVAVIADGRHTGALPGRALRRA